jgi:two-component system response regulator MprA
VVHVLVVEDDTPIAASLRRTLQYEGYRVSVAADGLTALAAVAADRPDLVVLDRMLGGMDGLSVCRRLRAGDESVPVLMLTARDTVADRVVGLDAGADDYLVKPFDYEELLARIRALLRRAGASGGGEQLAFGDIVLDRSAHECRRGSREIPLTALEFALLERFLMYPRQVLSRTQLLDAVWGIDFATASNVVDVYVGYLRTKLEADGEPRVLHTIRGVGYVLRQP